MSLKPTLSDVTLVIPTLGRESLARCLESVAGGTSWPVQVVIVDQGDDPRIEVLVQELVARGLSIHHIRSTERGTAAAMNRGLEHVATALVAVTHDDCLVDPEWLRLLAGRLHDAGRAILTGQVRPEGDAVVPGTITAPDPARYERPLVDRDPLFPDNMGFPMAVAEELGPFDEDERLRFAEDNEWSYRALRAGIPIIYAPELAVVHLGWRDLEQRAATYRNYARSQGGFYGKYLRRRDWFIALRALYDLARGPWMWLRGTVQRNPDLVAYGRAYMTALPAGLAAGLRGSW
jgi:GT2 family glycosyltransferase